MGSLTKFYLGNNVDTLTRKTAALAMEQLGDALHLNIALAKVTRVDVGMNIPTNHKVLEYYPYLLDAPYYQRTQPYANTLYYTNQKRQIIFYDKGKEVITSAKKAAKKGKEAGNAIQKYGIILNHMNLFRYELRYLKGINRQLNGDIRAMTLYNEAFYRSIPKRLYDEFHTIRKLKKQTLMTGEKTTPSKAMNTFTADMLRLYARTSQQNEQDIINERLAKLKAMGAFKDEKSYSRMKSMLNALITAKRGEEVELMSELDSKLLYIASNAE
jgi:hypothetical protein